MLDAQICNLLGLLMLLYGTDALEEQVRVMRVRLPSDVLSLCGSGNRKEAARE